MYGPIRKVFFILKILTYLSLAVSAVCAHRLLGACGLSSCHMLALVALRHV